MKKIIKELKEKYWEFQKEINTHTEFYGYYAGGGGGVSSKETYKDNAESFIRWLENKAT